MISRTPRPIPAARLPAVTIVLPVVNETYSLVETVNSILVTSKQDVRELLIIVCDKTTPESMATIKSLSPTS